MSHLLLLLSFLLGFSCVQVIAIRDPIVIGQDMMKSLKLSGISKRVWFEYGVTRC